MLSGFKQFILRGNVIDMAVGVVIGAAFGGVVTALTKDLLTPFIAAIVGKPDPVLGERVVAFVIPGEDGPPDVAALQAHVREHLASFKVPEEVFFVEEFPRTPTNKIIKKQLRERLVAADQPAADRPAADQAPALKQ